MVKGPPPQLNEEYVAMDGAVVKEGARAVVDLIVEERERYRNVKQAQKKWTIVIASISMAAFVSSLLALVLEGSLISFVAFAIPLITAPYVIHQRRKLNKIPTLVHVMNGIRQHANTLSSQNQTLERETRRLEVEVQRLDSAETALQQVAKQSSSNVDTICRLVADNADHIRQMKHLNNARELQTMLTAILQSDMDGNHVLSESELDILTLRLESFSAVDANKIRMALSDQTGSTTALYKIAASTSFGEDHVKTYGAGRVLQWLLDEGA